MHSKTKLKNAMKNLALKAAFGLGLIALVGTAPLAATTGKVAEPNVDAMTCATPVTPTKKDNSDKPKKEKKQKKQKKASKKQNQQKDSKSQNA